VSTTRRLTGCLGAASVAAVVVATWAGRMFLGSGGFPGYGEILI